MRRLTLFVLVLAPVLLIRAEGRVLGASEFQDAEAPACHRLPPQEPAQIRSAFSRGRLTVEILANFGCQTSAGDATAQLEGEVLLLTAHTILPGYPTPHCLCTRQLRYTLGAPESSARRIRYLQDSRPPVEAEVGGPAL